MMKLLKFLELKAVIGSMEQFAQTSGDSWDIAVSVEVLISCLMESRFAITAGGKVSMVFGRGIADGGRIRQGSAGIMTVLKPNIGWGLYPCQSARRAGLLLAHAVRIVNSLIGATGRRKSTFAGHAVIERNYPLKQTLQRRRNVSEESRGKRLSNAEKGRLLPPVGTEFTTQVNDVMMVYEVTYRNEGKATFTAKLKRVGKVSPVEVPLSSGIQVVGAASPEYMRAAERAERLLPRNHGGVILIGDREGRK